MIEGREIHETLEDLGLGDDIKENFFFGNCIWRLYNGRRSYDL